MDCNVDCTGKDHFGYGHSKWEKALLCNTYSHRRAHAQNNLSTGMGDTTTNILWHEASAAVRARIQI